MSKYLFVLENPTGKRQGCWSLKCSTKEEVLDYYRNTDIFAKDFAHRTKIEEMHEKLGSQADTNYVNSHTEFSGCVDYLRKWHNLDTVQDGYSMLHNLQLISMLKVLEGTGAVYINRDGGFHGERTDKTYTSFLRKDKLEFPAFYSNDIRIKRFPDGKHWYAYVGDAQVRDGDILKWDTYEEAENAASKWVRKTIPTNSEEK